MSPIVAVGASLAVALVAWRSGALTRDGALAATLVGTAVLWSTGWGGGAVLASFFVPSIVVGRVALARRVISDAPGERRNAVQVMANGAAGAAGALLEFSAPGLGFWILTGALAAAAADTWATSIGAFSSKDPRNLGAGRIVPRGTSGGVSALGTIAGLVGAITVAATGQLAGGGPHLGEAGTIIGFVGMLLDSLLGATVQARFQCPACGLVGERRHHCGGPTRPVEGWRWLDNDGVNALTTTLAAGLSALAWWVLAN